jgi:hypothetical protein
MRPLIIMEILTVQDPAMALISMFFGIIENATHVAESFDGTLSDCRSVAMRMKILAQCQNLDLRFCTILRHENIVDWAHKNRAKVLLPQYYPVAGTG